MTKQTSNTEVYNITIEGSEHSFTEQQLDEQQSETDQYGASSSGGVSFNQELKSKTGSDSSSEVPDDVKGERLKWFLHFLMFFF